MPALKLLLLAFVMVTVSLVQAWAQDATLNAESVRKAILAAPIWHVDTRGGFILWHFEMRGDKLWGQSVNSDGRSLPAVQVEVTNVGLMWTNPKGEKIVVRYDPEDIQFPFKGNDLEGGAFAFTSK